MAKLTVTIMRCQGDGQGQCLFEFEQNVGWDQRRFAAPAHQQFAMFYDGGLVLEASWSHPALSKATVDVLLSRNSVW